MYFKDYLKDLLKDANTTTTIIPLIPLCRSTESQCVTFSLDFTKLVQKGSLLHGVHAMIEESLKEKLKYCLIEFQGHVMDVARDENDFEFASFSNYPFPIYELNLVDNMGIPNIMHIHFFSVENWGEVDISAFGLQGNFSIPKNLQYIDRIPLEWGLSLEPSWNDMKLKIEKKRGHVLICESSGWIQTQKWIDYFLLGKDDDESSSDKDSEMKEKDDFQGYIPKQELSTELTTAKYLGLFPLDDNQKIHTYMQWRSLRTNIQNEIDKL